MSLFTQRLAAEPFECVDQSAALCRSQGAELFDITALNKADPEEAFFYRQKKLVAVQCHKFTSVRYFNNQ